MRSIFVALTTAGLLLATSLGASAQEKGSTRTSGSTCAAATDQVRQAGEARDLTDEAETDQLDESVDEGTQSETDKGDVNNAGADNAEADNADADQAEADNADGDQAEVNKAETHESKAHKADTDKHGCASGSHDGSDSHEGRDED